VVTVAEEVESMVEKGEEVDHGDEDEDEEET
jgi:hypothetical protein